MSSCLQSNSALLDVPVFTGSWQLLSLRLRDRSWRRAVAPRSRRASDAIFRFVPTMLSSSGPQFSSALLDVRVLTGYRQLLLLRLRDRSWRRAVARGRSRRAGDMVFALRSRGWLLRTRSPLSPRVTGSCSRWTWKTTAGDAPSPPLLSTWRCFVFASALTLLASSGLQYCSALLDILVLVGYRQLLSLRLRERSRRRAIAPALVELATRLFVFALTLLAYSDSLSSSASLGVLVITGDRQLLSLRRRDRSRRRIVAPAPPFALALWVSSCPQSSPALLGVLVFALTLRVSYGPMTAAVISVVITGNGNYW